MCSESLHLCLRASALKTRRTTLLLHVLALVRGDRAVYGILVRELVRRGQSVGAERLPRDDPEALDEGRDHLLGAVRAACVC